MLHVLTTMPCDQVSHLSLPQFIPDNHCVDDVSYRKDTRARVQPLDLSKVKREEPGAIIGDSGRSTAKGTGTATDAAVAAVTSVSSAFSATQLSNRSLRPEAQFDRSRNAEHHMAKLTKHAQHAAYASPAQFEWPLSQSLSDDKLTSRPALQLKSWQLSNATGIASESHNPDNLPAKAWQPMLSTASAHEQWVLQRHTTHGRMSEGGDSESWGELLVRVPQQASTVIEQLVQQLPEGLAGSVHSCAQTQVRLLSTQSCDHCCSCGSHQCVITDSFRLV